MPETFKRYLVVRDAPRGDSNELIVRIYEINKPRGIEWGDYINISVDGRNWVVCKLEKAGTLGIDRIFINKRLREMLNRNLTGILGARIRIPCHFYISKTPSWKAPWYIMHYHPNDVVRANMRLKIYGTTIGIIVAIIVSLLGLMRC